jgi:hypothetical protein
MAYRFIRNTAFEQEVRRFIHTNKILQILEIGDGILALKVEDHFDIYFDTGRWDITFKVKKEFRHIIFPYGILNTGVLPGRHFKGGAGDEDKIILIVKQKLVPRGSCYKLVTDPEEKPQKKNTIFGDIFGSGPDGDIFGEIFGGKRKA